MSIWALAGLFYGATALLLFPVYIWDGLKDHAERGLSVADVLVESAYVAMFWLFVFLFVAISSRLDRE